VHRAAYIINSELSVTYYKVWSKMSDGLMSSHWWSIVTRRLWISLFEFKNDPFYTLFALIKYFYTRSLFIIILDVSIDIRISYVYTHNNNTSITHVRLESETWTILLRCKFLYNILFVIIQYDGREEDYVRLESEEWKPFFRFNSVTNIVINIYEYMYTRQTGEVDIIKILYLYFQSPPPVGKLHTLFAQARNTSCIIIVLYISIYCTYVARL